MGLFSSIFGGDEKEKVEAAQIPAIDPQEIFRTQANYNRVNQRTPFGNLTFSGPNKSNLDFQLSPQLQSLFNQQTAFGTEGAQLGRGLLSGVPGSADAASAALLERLQPQFDQREATLRNQLEQSGNPAAFGGTFSEGAFNELSLLQQSENDARLAAILAGPQYQGGLLNNAIGAANASPIGVPQFNFQGASPIDVLGGYNLASGVNQFNAGGLNNARSFNAAQQQRSNQGLLGGLFDLGSAGIAGFFS